MTAKHFNQLARLVNDIAINGGSVGAEALAYRLAEFCAADADRFQRDRFIAACLKDSLYDPAERERRERIQRADRAAA